MIVEILILFFTVLIIYNIIVTMNKETFECNLTPDESNPKNKCQIDTNKSNTSKLMVLEKKSNKFEKLVPELNSAIVKMINTYDKNKKDLDKLIPLEEKKKK